MAHKLDLMSRAEIPMVNCPAVMCIEPKFRQQWIRFLWRYRRRSPLLFNFMAYGTDWAADRPRLQLQRKIDILESWITQAKEDFKKSKVRFFWDCSVLNHKDRPKHWRPTSFSKARVQRESLSNREGIFMPSMTLFFIEQGLWCIFANQFDRVLRRQLRFASFDFKMEVGFANGTATSIVRYDISYPAVHAHAYPISPAEAQKHPYVTLDDVGLEIPVQ